MLFFFQGDGTQRRLLEARISFAKIRGVFVTHLHGDHVYGLVPLLAMISMTCPNTANFFVVGPHGTRRFIEEASASTQLYLRYQLHIVELAHDRGAETQHVQVPFHQPFEIIACPLRHRVPCFGYVFCEPNPRVFDAASARLKGVQVADLGKLARGEHVLSATNGELVCREQCLIQSVSGRIVVILGDTCNSDSVASALAGRGCDVLVHECTYDEDLQEKAQETGHSTSQDAGAFAKRIQAKTLIITHFSARYPVSDRPLPCPKAADSDEDLPLKNSANLLLEAQSAAGTNVKCQEARDFSVFQIPPPQAAKPKKK